MHEHHNIFARGVERQTKIHLTFYSWKRRQNVVRPCAPLYYSEGVEAGDGMDCYYFWDLEATRGNNFLALPPSEIVSMGPMQDAFRVEELLRRDAVPGKPKTTR